MGGDYMSDLIYLKGVGPKTLSLLNKLEINDIDDLVTHYPYKYEVLKRSDVSSLNQDDKIIIDGIVENVPVVYRFKSIDKMQFNINIGSNIYKVIIFNRGFMKTNINIGSQLIAIGKFDKKNNTIVASEILLNENLNNIKIIPFYRTCDGLNRKTLKKINSLLEDISRNGNEGIGKPEPLTGNLAGFWSRRINDKDRLIYKFDQDNIYVLACRYHYSDK